MVEHYQPELSGTYRYSSRRRLTVPMTEQALFDRGLEMRPLPDAAPAAVYLLADNLDAALASAEDLLKSKLAWHAESSCSAEEIAAKRREERCTLEAMRSLEMILIARVLKAREYADELIKYGAVLKPVAKLYNAGTIPLQEAVAEFASASALDFDAGDGATAYLRSRGLIASDAPAPAVATTITLSEQFLVAGLVPLGALMDLLAMFLDTLETHYDLYDEAERIALAMLAGKPTSNSAAL